jgi:Na+-transporting methylmalonyl-CoA/oxaloacetate decarboxylase gamma subunit
MAVNYFANPPPGLDLTESRTATNNAIGIVLFVLSLVFVALRLVSKVGEFVI